MSTILEPKMRRSSSSGLSLFGFMASTLVDPEVLVSPCILSSVAVSCSHSSVMSTLPLPCSFNHCNDDIPDLNDSSNDFCVL